MISEESKIQFISSYRRRCIPIQNEIDPCERNRRLITPVRDVQKLALRWRASGKDCTLTLITVMAATPIFIGQSVEVGSG